MTWKEFGGTHPKDPGNRLAADLIADLLDAAWSDPTYNQPRSKSHRSARIIDENSYAKGSMLPPSAAELGVGWVVHKPDWAKLPGSNRQRFNDMQLLCSTEVDSECSLEFTGKGIGLFVLAGPDAGIVEYQIDDGEIQEADLYHRHSKGLHYPRTVMLDADLDRGKHRLKLRIAKKHNTSSVGNAVRILKFAVNQ